MTKTKTRTSALNNEMSAQDVSSLAMDNSQKRNEFDIDNSQKRSKFDINSAS